MPRLFSELSFSPTISDLISNNERGKLVVLTGGNNSGKSAYLKKTVDDPTHLYIGVNRFYHFHHMSLYSENRQEMADWYRNMRHHSQSQEFHNFEQSFFNSATAIARLSDDRRAVLFDVFTRLFGQTIEVRSEDPKNQFSNRYISVDGDSLSVTSSGTRLFLGILAALMDDRFSMVAIDEPELGLSPILQRRLAEIVVSGRDKDSLFPHRPNILLSTHSHHFLDRDHPENNWVVQKAGSAISARPCEGWQGLQDIQYRLLGNDLGELFLPDIVIFVEGETDQMFLDRILSIKLPNIKIVIQSCSGDISARLSYWAASLGDMQLSPYRTRTFVVYDSVKQAGIERACDKAGLPVSSRVEWSSNGIEFLYPESILRDVFKRSDLTTAEQAIDRDRVTVGDISYTKMQLCRLVCDRTTAAVELPTELEERLVVPLKGLFGH